MLGCMVPWMAQPNSCQGPFQRLPEHEALLNWIFVMVLNSIGGKQYESKKCPLPCKILSVKSTFLQTEGLPEGDANYFILFFSNDVQVRRIVLAYGLDDLLVEVGSCLGLWLGLSVVGVFDIMVLTLIQLKMAVQHLRSVQI